ncbi:MAG: hypothetical protein KC444_08970 [Nitrosopumilus sp.]|nr:hypothetical protein [Nitrosopumilus sp.]
MDENGITTIINNVKEAINKSEESNDVRLSSDIKFELAVIAKKEAGGKIRFIIVEAGGGYEKETVSKIIFSMNRPHGYTPSK